MGYYRLPKPGEKEPGGREIGVCVDDACGHKDCDQTRADAKSICRICKKEVGYDTNFFYEETKHGVNDGFKYHTLVHASCLYDEVKGGGEGDGE